MDRVNGKQHGCDEGEEPGDRKGLRKNHGKKAGRDQENEGTDPCMKQDIDEMEAPRCQAKEKVAQQIDNVQEGSVVVGTDPLKCPDIGGENIGNGAEIPDPGILHHLRDVVINESVAESVPIYQETHGDNDGEQGRPEQSYVTR
jgi:hypothetical protein